MAMPYRGVLCSYLPAQKQPINAFLVFKISTRFLCPSILMLKLVFLCFRKSYINLVFLIVFPISFWIVSNRNFFSYLRVSKRSPAKMLLLAKSMQSFMDYSFSRYYSKLSLKSLFLLFSAQSSAINLQQFTSLLSFFAWLWPRDRSMPMIVSLIREIYFMSSAFLAYNSFAFAILLERQHMFL